MAHWAKELAELIEKHKLGSGRIVGGPIHDPREFTPVPTPELVSDLERLKIHFQRSRADNPEHPDCGKPIVIFTLFQERD